MFGNFFKEGILHSVAHFGYFGGLAALVPTLTVALKLNQAPWSVFPPTFWLALGAVLISLVAIFILKKGFGNAMMAIGITTMIPGVLALLFSIVSQEQVFNGISAKITGFSVVAPVFSFFIEHSVPKMAYIAVAYIVIGYIVFKMGVKLKEGF
jgi:lysylphosphatidylglycerol synthetase-like protein (DUF2156 family)